MNSTIQRLGSIDRLRGAVMVLMLVDHVREFFYLHLQVSDPMSIASTPPELFFHPPDQPSLRTGFRPADRSGSLALRQ